MMQSRNLGSQGALGVAAGERYAEMGMRMINP
jgi:hypothetical protein